MSGSLNVWDLCLRQTAPSLAIQVRLRITNLNDLFAWQVCDESLHSIRVHEQGRLVACGSHSGVVTLLELSGALSVLQPNEKHNINAVCALACVP